MYSGSVTKATPVWVSSASQHILQKASCLHFTDGTAEALRGKIASQQTNGKEKKQQLPDAAQSAPWLQSWLVEGWGTASQQETPTGNQSPLLTSELYSCNSTDTQADTVSNPLLNYSPCAVMSPLVYFIDCNKCNSLSLMQFLSKTKQKCNFVT